MFAFCFKFAYSVIEKTQPVISVLRRAASRSFFDNDGSHLVFSRESKRSDENYDIYTLTFR